MDNFDWEEEIYLTILLVKVMGLWPMSKKIFNFDVSLVYIFVIIVIIITGHDCSQIVNVIFVYSDVNQLISMIFLTSTNLLAYFKAIVFLRNSKVIKSIFQTLREKQYLPADIKQFKRIESSPKMYRKIFKYYVAVATANLILWTSTPIIAGTVKTWELPFIAWYPFNYKKRVIFEITYMYQTVAIWYITLGNVAMDSTFYAMTMLVWVQCEILCDNAARLDKHFKKNLIKCIKHYEGILTLVRTYNKIFSVTILFQFATSTAVLALAMYQLSTIGVGNKESMPILAYLLGMTVQSFQYCWFANTVTTKSEKICDSLYQSNWTSQSTDSSKLFLIFFNRCQRPIRISDPFKLFSLSLEVFINILRSSWSYFTMLYQVNNK